MKFVHCVCFAAAVAQKNPPTWPSSVQVFSPEDATSKIEQVVNAAFKNNGGTDPANNGQFSDERYAFLFKPGSYDVDVPVGYYTQVAGLGKSPSDVMFTSVHGPYSDEGARSVQDGSLDTFWRSAENFETRPQIGHMVWAVSQAAPLRRVIVDNDLFLFVARSCPESNCPADFASGGFMGNSKVGGQVISASQQQWMTRNSEVGSWSNGVWNQVFVGTKGAPASHCGGGEGTNPYVNVELTPKIAEKPFITIDDHGLYSLNIPQVQSNYAGVSFDGGDEVGFEDVYVADHASDTATTINAALEKGLHVVLSPGIYSLDSSLQLNHTGQVILGLGLATLIAAKGQPAIKVGNVDGARVAGVLLQAGHLATDSLLQWGEGSYAGNAEDPGFLHDVFMRVGGPAAATKTQVKVMLQINSGNVIGDNMWLWRADHVEGGGLVKNGDNPCDNAVVVNGDDVIMYGLAAEHTLQDITKWNGENGAVYFYQAELPYDVTQEYGDKNFAGYRVSDDVKSHTAYGVGVYHYFRDFPVTVPSGIVAPRALEDSFHQPLGAYLNGLGTVTHVMNDKGVATKNDNSGGAVPAWICSGDPWPSPVSTPAPSPNPTTLAPSPATTTTPSLSPSPPPHGSCTAGEAVECSSGEYCQGPECCQDGTICPSADNSNLPNCPVPKKSYDCTTRRFVV